MAFYFRVNEELNLVAVFSPKCACTSIKKWMDALAQASARRADLNANHAYNIGADQFAAYTGYRTVLFLRDPLRRLASFYAHWVVKRPGRWDFADAERRFWLRGKSFRRFLFVLDHLARHDLAFQHHLESQLGNLPGFEFQHLVLVENLLEGIQMLNTVLGYKVLPAKRYNCIRKNKQLTEFVGDRTPRWLAENGIPDYSWFYDSEMVAMAKHIYTQDVDLYQRQGGQLLNPAEPC